LQASNGNPQVVKGNALVNLVNLLGQLHPPAGVVSGNAGEEARVALVAPNGLAVPRGMAIHPMAHFIQLAIDEFQIFDPLHGHTSVFQNLVSQAEVGRDERILLREGEGATAAREVAEIPTLLCLLDSLLNHAVPKAHGYHLVDQAICRRDIPRDIIWIQRVLKEILGFFAGKDHILLNHDPHGILGFRYRLPGGDQI